MHRSRLTALFIDVPADDYDAASRFWAGAFGSDVRQSQKYEEYRGVGSPRGLEAYVQRLGSGDARLHLDIETDDVDAEVARLEALGATGLEAVESWWIMQDPAGVVFCVVPPQGGDFPADSTEWE
ncbi:MAG: VOC family protein [Acidimicrobiales bacterium]